MADYKKEESQEEEKKIPVFTVLKKGNIIKNIFLLHNHRLPQISEPNSVESEENCKTPSNHKDEEEILLVGRHPDCNIMLEHPSISRFHLRIHLRPSSQKLSVIDLSSAHGTWVSDQKIEPKVRVELREGDTLRLGTSTRIYRLHWFPLSSASDMENRLISSILENPLPPEEKEDEDDDDETYQNENQIPCLREQKEIPSAPPMPENMNNSFTNDDDEEEEVLFAAPMLEEKENQSPLRRLDQRDILSIWSRPVESESVNSSWLPFERAPLETRDQEFDKENQENIQTGFAVGEPFPSERDNQESPPRKSELKSDAPSLWSRRGKSAGLLRVQTGRSREKKMGVCADVQIEAENQNEIKGDTVSKILFCGSDEEEEIFTPDKENCTPKTVLGLKSMKKSRLEEIKQLKSSGSLSSKVIIDSSPDQEEGRFIYSEKENLTPIVFQDSKSMKHASGRSQVRLEAEMIMSKRRTGRVPFQSLVANYISKSKSEVSDLKATTTKSSNSVNCSLTIEENSIPSSNQSVDKEANRRRWNMVVDTSCLLNKESRRSLKLLQGLKGTHLIIPRMVIRELDCLKRRGSLFRKATEISSVLKWIEECMVKAKWWIHVQNSLEEGMLIAPTPPASPRSRLSEGSRGIFSSSVPFSTCGNLMEIVSPTAEDHILECALLFKRVKNNDGQLVLLTNDVSLKIKAMAEGLLCETAEAFCESLVNPLSERFLWVESTPRGSTWSCLDEADLREKYKHFPVKKTAKAAEGAKGLKLILLHNSNYVNINSVK